MSGKADYKRIPRGNARIVYLDLREAPFVVYQRGHKRWMKNYLNRVVRRKEKV